VCDLSDWVRAAPQDFTHLSACSRSEVGAELSFAALNEQAMEELGERLRALLARIAEEQERGNRRRALALMEESLGVRLEMEGPQGAPAPPYFVLALIELYFCPHTNPTQP
jgi:hypothetical protein